MNDLRHEGRSFFRDSGGGSGHGFCEGSSYGPRVESGAIPAPGLVAGHQQSSEGHGFGPTGRINSSCDADYSTIGHCHMVGNCPRTKDSCPPRGCGQENSRGNIYGVGDGTLVREGCPPYEDSPPGVGCSQPGMTKSEAWGSGSSVRRDCAAYLEKCWSCSWLQR